MNPYHGKHISSAPGSGIPSLRRGRHQVRNRRRRRWVYIVLIAALIVLLYPLLEARLLQVDRKTLQADDLPSDAGSLRIVYLSDIHYGFWFTDGNLGSLISRINALRPDLVLFGGDYSTDNEGAVRFFSALQQHDTIHSRYGIYGVIGEADRGDSDLSCTRVTEAMANAGVTPLVNRTASVNIGSRQIFIAGLDDVSTGKPDVRSVARSVSSCDYVILLCHSPAIIPDAQLAVDSSGNLGWFDLGLFGHTHGGQMLFISSLLGIAEEVPDRYRSGWIKENRVDMLISPGVGTSVFPGRLFCYPSIHCITVTD